MNRCPQCKETFSEEYSFCLHDGTPLVSEVPDEPTVVRASPVTGPVAVPPEPVYVPVQTPQSAWVPAETAVVEPVKRRGVNPVFALLGVGLLALIAGGAAVLWLGADRYITSNDRAAANVNSSGNADLGNANQKVNRAAADSRNSNSQNSNAETNSNSNTNAAKPSPTATPKKEAAVPAEEEAAIEVQGLPTFPVTRIKFGRGKVSQTVSGRIGEGRDFVLYTLDGQELSATVNSPGGCVVFENGSSSTGFATDAGDNFLHLENNCDGAKSFTLTVRVR